MSQSLIDEVFDTIRPQKNDPNYQNIWNRKMRLRGIEFQDSQFSREVIRYNLIGDLSLDIVKILKDEFWDLESFFAVDATYFYALKKYTQRMVLQIILMQYKMRVQHNWGINGFGNSKIKENTRGY